MQLFEVDPQPVVVRGNGECVLTVIGNKITRLDIEGI